jgi:polyisoprenoid-binding protein YceI
MKRCLNGWIKSIKHKFRVIHDRHKNILHAQNLNGMKSKINVYLLTAAFLASLFTVANFVSCRHDNVVPPTGGSNGSNIERGDVKIGLTDGKTTFDKAHSNVNWSTPYLGAVAVLTGKFNTFGFNSFHFEESNADSIYFEAYVYLNSVNTGEPNRDGGCLLGTFGTSAGLGYVDSNLAIIKTTKVELSTTDKGYIVTANFTFHGVTKSITAKLDYVGKTDSGDSEVYGLNLKFSILAISDFGIASTSIADNVDIGCSANFKHTP